MLFTTASGSRYEIDHTNKQIRRLSGNTNPTARQGRDGAWKKFKTISEIIINKNVTIIWDLATPPLAGTLEFIDSPGIVIPMTVTSLVTVIDE